MKLVWTLNFLLTVVLTCGSSASEYTSSFHRETEFPSYLADGSPADQAAIRKELEEILKLRFNNMTIPVPTTEQEYKRVKFMDWAKSEAQKLGFGHRIKLYPSGGLIRNNVSEIYELVHAEKVRDPKKSVMTILQEIKRQVPDEVFHTQIRGVGSDFDVLIGGLTTDELKRFNAVLGTQITQFEKSSGLMSTKKNGASALKKSFLVVPDFKDVAEQITRATGQGGLEGDFLFFDLQEGRLKDPPQLGTQALKDAPYLQRYSGASDRLLTGKVQYHSPYNHEVIRQGVTDAQTVRSLRTLSEAPWTHIDDISGAFVQEMRQAIRKGSLSPKAQEQLTKMLRNSRFGGGSNRFTRLPEYASDVEKVIFEFREKFPGQFRTFLARSSKDKLLAKFSEAPEGLKKALMLSESWPETLFHGVPSVEVLPSIARNGLILSTTDVDDKTTAAFGDGAYSSEKFGMAKSYSKDTGVVIPIHLNKDAKVIDWSRLDRITRKTLEEEARVNKVPLNVYLHDKYGVQVVKNEHFLILDMAALEKPVKNYSDILKFYVNNIMQLPARERNFTDIVSALQIAKYAELSGEPGIEAILNRAKLGKNSINWDKMLAESFGREPVNDIKAFSTLNELDFSSSTFKRIIHTINTESFKREFSKELWIDPKMTPSLLRDLSWQLDGIISPSVTNEKFNHVVHNQLKSVISEGSRLRAEVLRNPMAYALLLSASRNESSIHENIRRIFSQFENSKEIESKLVAELKIAAEKGFYSKWSILNEIPEELNKRIIPQLPRTTEALEHLMDLAFDSGKLTKVGRLLVDLDPVGMKNKLIRLPYKIQASSSELDFLVSKGIPKDILLKSIDIRVVGGELTESSKWVIQHSNPESLPKMYQYDMVQLKKSSDLKLLLQAGYPIEKIVEAPESVLLEMGWKVRTSPDGSKTFKLPSLDTHKGDAPFKRVLNPSSELANKIQKAKGDPEKLQKILAELRLEFDKNSIKVAKELLGALESKDQTVKNFTQKILRENTEMRSLTAKASLIARRKDIFDAIPLDLNNPDDQKLLKTLDEIKNQGSRGLIAEHAQKLRAKGNSKPSGVEIYEELKKSEKQARLEIAKGMEEVNFVSPLSAAKSGCLRKALENLVSTSGR